MASDLFTPGNIGRCKLKNRVIMAPMGNINMADPAGRPTQKMIDYFTERAKGGTGLLITGLVPVSYGIDPTVSEDSDTTYFPRIDGSSRTRMSGWRDLTASVHSYNTKIFIQLTAGLGRVGSPEAALKGKVLKSSSFNSNFYVPFVPHFPLTDRQLKKIIKSFSQCAINAKVSGFDGVQIHGHEGYLMDQMTSAPWNRRIFGRYRNKFQFAVDTVRAVKELCGDDFPILYRIDITQALQQSYGDIIFKKKFRNMERTLEEGLEFCRILAEAGVDAFDVDKGCYDNWFYPHPPAYFKDMPYVLETAGRVKEYFLEHKIKAQVVAVGKLGKPEVAKKVIADGIADFVMMGRPLLADPYWCQKVANGREKEVNHCMGDQEGCIHSFILGGHPCCTVNPYAGFEDVKKLSPTEKMQNIAIIGAGPGGCEAAKTCFLRGHKVTLFEKSGKLGGQLVPGSMMKIKHDLARYVENLTYQMDLLAKQGLKIKLNTAITVNELKDQYDVIICANGLKPVIPKLEGMDKVKHIESRELLLNGMKIPDDVQKITIVGGGVVGCELGYSLAYEQQKEVTIIEMLPTLMTGVVHANRSMLLWLMMGHGSPTEIMTDKLKIPIKAYTASKVVKLGVNQVIVHANRKRKNPYTPWETLIAENVHVPFVKKLDPNNLEELTLDTDLVVFATGGISDDSLYYELLSKKIAPQIYAIGDSAQPGRAWEAITAANDIARFV